MVIVKEDGRKALGCFVCCCSGKILPFVAEKTSKEICTGKCHHLRCCTPQEEEAEDLLDLLWVVAEEGEDNRALSSLLQNEPPKRMKNGSRPPDPCRLHSSSESPKPLRVAGEGGLPLVLPRCAVA